MPPQRRCVSEQRLSDGTRVLDEEDHAVGATATPATMLSWRSCKTCWGTDGARWMHSKPSTALRTNDPYLS